MTLRQHLAQVIVDALVRAAVWLLRAQELPPLQLPSRRVAGCWCLECRELQLHRMAQLGEVLRYVDRQVPVPSYPVDLRWPQ